YPDIRPTFLNASPPCGVSLHAVPLERSPRTVASAPPAVRPSPGPRAAQRPRRTGRVVVPQPPVLGAVLRRTRPEHPRLRGRRTAPPHRHAGADRPRLPRRPAPHVPDAVRAS